jgi:hypothetical protein
LFFCGLLAHGQVLAHFFEFFWADAFDGQEIVDTFEQTVGFSSVEDFLRSGRADAGDLLEIGSVGGVDVDGMGGRFLLGEGYWQCREGKSKDGEENARYGMSAP